MFGSVIIEIAIGLVFVYLLLSFVVTAIQELIDSVFKLRAIHLAKGIQKLLGEEKAKEFFAHALIKGLSPDKLIIGTGTRKPSYIPPRTFVTTLIDIITNAGGAAQRTVVEVQTGINNISSDDLRKSLTVLLDECKRDLTEFEKRLETWFNDQMDRVSGWYKRKTQLITVLAALLITVIMNADTLAIVKTLSSNPTLRAALVKQAEEVTKSRSDYQKPQETTKDAKAKEGDERSAVEVDQANQTKNLEFKNVGKPNSVKAEPANPTKDPKGKKVAEPVPAKPELTIQKEKNEAEPFKEISQRFEAVERSIDKVQGLGLPVAAGWWKNSRYTATCPEIKEDCYGSYCPRLKDDEGCKSLGLFRIGDSRMAPDCAGCFTGCTLLVRHAQ